MPFFNRNRAARVLSYLPKPFTRLKIFIMKQKGVIRVGLSLYLGFKVPKFVKMKAYKRVRNGKV